MPADQDFEAVFPRKWFGTPYGEPEEYLADLMGLEGLLVEGYVLRRGETARRRAEAERFMDSRKEKSGLFFAPDYLGDRFELSPLERHTLLLSLLPLYDGRRGAALAALGEGPDGTRPDCALALRLFEGAERVEDVPEGRRRLRDLRTRCELLFFTGGEGALDPGVADFLLRNGGGPLPWGSRLRQPEEFPPPPALGEGAERMAEQIGRYRGDDLLAFHLHAPAGAGGRTLAGLAAARHGWAVLYVPLQGLDDGGLLSVCRQSLLRRAWPCFCLEPAGEDREEDCVRSVEAALARAWQFCRVAFVRTAPPLVCKPRVDGVFWLECPVPPPDRGERLALWRHYAGGLPLEDPAEPEALADKVRLLPGQIAAAAKAAEAELLWRAEGAALERGALDRCAAAQVGRCLEGRAARIPAGYDWDALVLAGAEKRMLRDACDQVRFRRRVYQDWGFQRRVTYGRGVSLLFAGPPGTGKTMAAQVVAGALGLELYKVDLSQVVSKYIGETEKNLGGIFDDAERSGAILLFDETDALLGKRTEVKDSHDKNANLETSFLLQKLEEYEGVAILTTNYLENIDPAFFRRLSRVIHFPFPGVPERERLWRGMFPPEAPLAPDVDFPFLARRFELAGGGIKNAAVTAAFLAAGGGEPIGMRHIVNALRLEVSKQGKILMAEEFGEYSYLLQKED